MTISGALQAARASHVRRIQGIEAEGYSHPGNIQLPSYQATMKVARKGAQVPTASVSEASSTQPAHDEWSNAPSHLPGCTKHHPLLPAGPAPSCLATVATKALQSTRPSASGAGAALASSASTSSSGSLVPR